MTHTSEYNILICSMLHFLRYIKKFQCIQGYHDLRLYSGSLCTLIFLMYTSEHAPSDHIDIHYSFLVDLVDVVSKYSGESPLVSDDF